MHKPAGRHGEGGTAKIRCAIYTRKSTEEGLEQEFNSLDAQREACAAYILSQRHEGWTELPDIYDDGGYSGGNMERPALKALLAKVAAGKVDVIVVYKVDRLTRALSDFAKIVDVLDAANASFVSVTQSFNTTTSMGRLTLNVLLSFAQFEREVTGERIRDKIAASKAKGMFMGGPVPLGYNVVDRKLIIDEGEAATVRMIFTRYLDLGSGRALQVELDQRGVRSKRRVYRGGRPYGEQPISRGPLYVILQNRIYVGDMVHKGKAYPGLQDPIIDPQLFDRVQAQLASARVQRRHGVNAREPSLLAGLMRDEHGRMMSPSHAVKQQRRYRYYVSQVDGARGDLAAAPAWRVGAVEIERIICCALTAEIHKRVHERSRKGDLDSEVITRLQNARRGATAVLDDAPGSEQRALLLLLIRRIDVSVAGLTIDWKLDAIDALLAEEDGLKVSVALPPALIRVGKQAKMLLETEGSATPADANLVKLLARAFAVRKAILESSSLDQGAAELGYGRDYAIALTRVSYLAPSIVKSILGGLQPKTLSATPLVRTPRLPYRWEQQCCLFGAA
ncbi:recombinase family protein [Sphingomonas sp.]|uniref:recombinase family protein n=1 Tax=Sphingomonas sp. TaxID=28214 RepID=UPI0025CE29DD|nr:recombinase family protein [Sphingomonas sp.]